MMVANESNEELIIPNATVLGVAEEISESVMISAGNRSKSGSQTDQQREWRKEALNQKLLQGRLDHLSEEEGKLIELEMLE